MKTGRPEDGPKARTASLDDAAQRGLKCRQADLKKSRPNRPGSGAKEEPLRGGSQKWERRFPMATVEIGMGAEKRYVFIAR